MEGKLEEFDPQTCFLGEDDESDSLQQSLGSIHDPSLLQQNIFGPRYTQSQLKQGTGSMFKTSICHLLCMITYILTPLKINSEQREGPNPLSLY